MTLNIKNANYKTIKNVVGQRYSMNSKYGGKWSPRSDVGKIYEWNRGVIGILPDGKIAKEALDETTTHHASATLKIAESFNVAISKTIHPFKAGVVCAKAGILVLQFEGDMVYLYFPQNISEEQLRLLVDLIIPRQNFQYSYVHEEDIIDSKTGEEVLEFAESITNKISISR